MGEVWPPTEMPRLDPKAAASLDKFFGDEHAPGCLTTEIEHLPNRELRGSGTEMPSCTVPAQPVVKKAFRVSVPSGVQYRKSKNLADRYSRYAYNGTIIVGVVEGEWLCVDRETFLPL